MIVLNWTDAATEKASVMQFTDGEMATAVQMAVELRDHKSGKVIEVAVYQYDVSRSGARRQIAVDAYNSPKTKRVTIWNGAEVVKLPPKEESKEEKPKARKRKAPIVSVKDISAPLVAKTPARTRRKSVAKALSNA